MLTPEAAGQEAKLTMMGRLSRHIDEAYPVTTAHIFVREASGSDLARTLGSDLPSKNHSARGAHVCFLICSPGVKADATKTMMEKLCSPVDSQVPGYCS